MQQLLSAKLKHSACVIVRGTLGLHKTLTFLLFPITTRGFDIFIWGIISFTLSKSLHCSFSFLSDPTTNPAKRITSSRLCCISLYGWWICVGQHLCKSTPDCEVHTAYILLYILLQSLRQNNECVAVLIIRPTAFFLSFLSFLFLFIAERKTWVYSSLSVAHILCKSTLLI